MSKDAPAYNPNAPPPYAGQQQQQYPPPGQQYPPTGQQYPPPGQQYPQAAGQATVQQAPGVVVITSGNSCPSCHVGYIREDYTCCGIALAILFFPLGLICCLLMKEKRCSHCSQTFG